VRWTSLTSRWRLASSYMAVVLDWFSRQVLSWRVSITMEAARVETLEGCRSESVNRHIAVLQSPHKHRHCHIDSGLPRRWPQIRNRISGFQTTPGRSRWHYPTRGLNVSLPAFIPNARRVQQRHQGQIPATSRSALRRIERLSEQEFERPCRHRFGRNAAAGLRRLMAAAELLALREQIFR
jgi:hypothetical protein